MSSFKFLYERKCTTPISWDNLVEKIMVVIDKLSKFAHFIPMKSIYKAIDITEIFMKEIFRLHGIPKMVISNRDVKFMSNVWK